MQKQLEGRVALVTGGTRGIGAAICRQLAESGAKVATNYRNEAHADKWRAEMNAAGFEPRLFNVDVTDFDGCKEMVSQIESELGAVDILVNNAGITQDVTLRKMSRDQWDKVIRTDLDSVFNVTRHVIEGMMNRGWGRVINISSINGQKGQIGQTNYTAAKAGMHGFTMSLAQEVARKGVTVNTISPGYIATDMVLAVPEDIRKQVIAQIPVGRFGTSEEVAGLVDYLASNAAAFITGADIAINGGQHMM